MLPDNFENEHKKRIEKLKNTLESCNNTIKDLKHEYEKIDMVNLAIKAINAYVEPYQELLTNNTKFANILYSKVNHYYEDISQLDKGSSILNECDQTLDYLINTKKMFEAYKNIIDNILKSLTMDFNSDEQRIENYEDLDQDELFETLDGVASSLIDFNELHPLIAKKLGWI